MAIGHHPDPEFMALYQRYQRGGPDGKQAIEEIIRRYTPFVVRKVNKYTVNAEFREALIVAGKLGIYQAVERFDPRRQIKFMTYAGYWIQVMITRTYIQESSIIKTSAKAQTLRKKVEEVSAIWRHWSGTEVTDEELAALTGLTFEEIKWYRQALPHCDCYSELLQDQVEDFGNRSPVKGTEELVLARVQYQKLVALAKKSLTPQLYEVFSLMQGLGPGQNALTVEQTAAALRLSRMQVSWRYRKALAILRRQTV